jgi:DSF synthase
MQLKNHPGCRLLTEAGALSQMTVWYEEERKTLWVMQHAHPRPCFNLALLADLDKLKNAIVRSGLEVDFWVTGSDVPGIFNVGGDLSFFVQQIRSRNLESLRAYAHACIEGTWGAMNGFGVGAITIAMIEGTALGGGLESALAHEYVFAQKDAKMGFPEIAFNLFPGMGAYSLVARKAGDRVAEQLIRTGEAHSGEWFAERGLVDKTFDAGESFKSARTFIDELQPKLNGVRAMLRARRRIQGISKQELIDITDDWARSAFHLREEDLAYMERLVMLQNRRMGKPPLAAAA